MPFSPVEQGSASYPPPPPIPIQATKLADPPPPWNPIWIGLLGVVFSPIWAGAMASINAYRIGLGPVWRPLAIGVGAVLIDLLMPFHSYLFSLCVYVIGLALIWFLDLAPQQKAWEKQSQDRRADLLVPTLLGLPFAFIALLSFVVLPLIPAFPREVCQSFLDTKTAEAAKEYVAGDMLPLVEQKRRIEVASKDLEPGQKPPVSNEMFLLTDESVAPAEVGGYYVGWYADLPTDDNLTYPVEGFFHLAKNGGNWKILGWFALLQDEDDEPVELFDMTNMWNHIASDVEGMAKVNLENAAVANGRKMIDHYASDNAQLTKTDAEQLFPILSAKKASEDEKSIFEDPKTYLVGGKLAAGAGKFKFSKVLIGGVMLLIALLGGLLKFLTGESESATK